MGQAVQPEHGTICLTSNLGQVVPERSYLLRFVTLDRDSDGAGAGAANKLDLGMLRRYAMALANQELEWLRNP